MERRRQDHPRAEHLGCYSRAPAARSHTRVIAVMSDTQEYRIGSLAAVEAGQPVLTEAAGPDVALFMCRGKVIATNGPCPHAEGPLHEGRSEEHTSEHSP